MEQYSFRFEVGDYRITVTPNDKVGLEQRFSGDNGYYWRLVEDGLPAGLFIQVAKIIRASDTFSVSRVEVIPPGVQSEFMAGDMVSLRGGFVSHSVLWGETRCDVHGRICVAVEIAGEATHCEPRELSLVYRAEKDKP